MKKLVSDGVINWDTIQESQLSEHDLPEEMRLNANVEDITQVASAYKEGSGSIGVVRKPSEAKVLEVTVTESVQTIRIVIEN